MKMNRADRRRAERESRNQPRKAYMSIPDLGAIKARNDLKAQIPPYEVRQAKFTLPSAVPVGEKGPSFRDALDRCAFNLGIDGWKIDTVESAGLVNVANSEQGPVAVFELVVWVSPIEQAETTKADFPEGWEDDDADR